jgi:hypothetical protein
MGFVHRTVLSAGAERALARSARTSRISPRGSPRLAASLRLPINSRALQRGDDVEGLRCAAPARRYAPSARRALKISRISNRRSGRRSALNGVRGGAPRLVAQERASGTAKPKLDHRLGESAVHDHADLESARAVSSSRQCRIKVSTSASGVSSWEARVKACRASRSPKPSPRSARKA